MIYVIDLNSMIKFCITNYYNILIANTPHEFEQAIYLLIENKKLAKKIGTNGKQLVKSFFSKKFAINKWKKIIN